MSRRSRRNRNRNNDGKNNGGIPKFIGATDAELHKVFAMYVQNNTFNTLWKTRTDDNQFYFMFDAEDPDCRRLADMMVKLGYIKSVESEIECARSSGCRAWAIMLMPDTLAQQLADNCDDYIGHAARNILRDRNLRPAYAPLMAQSGSSAWTMAVPTGLITGPINTIHMVPFKPGTDLSQDPIVNPSVN